MKCDLEQATYIIPVAQTASEKVAALRTWASGRSLNADVGGVFQKNRKSGPKEFRRITTRMEGRNGHGPTIEG